MAADVKQKVDHDKAGGVGSDYKLSARHGFRQSIIPKSYA
jgi:hypothetical protein